MEWTLRREIKTKAIENKNSYATLFFMDVIIRRNQFRRIIRYPAEPVQGVPPDYLLSGGTIPVSRFRRIICYPEEQVFYSIRNPSYAG